MASVPLFSLSEAKVHLNIPAEITTDDTELESWILPVTQVVERYVGADYTSPEATVPPGSHKKAGLIILAHMWDTQRGGGGMPSTDPYTTTTPNAFGFGYFVPNRAKELMGAQMPGIG